MLRQKPTQVLPWKLLKEATIHFYCLLDESRFSDIYVIIELKELNWLRRHMKNNRSSQLCISMNFCTESSSSMWVSLRTIPVHFKVHIGHRGYYQDMTLSCLHKRCRKYSSVECCEISGAAKQQSFLNFYKSITVWRYTHIFVINTLKNVLF